MRDGRSVLGVRVRGALEGYAAGFAEFLTGQGYMPGSAHLQVQLVAQLSRWLEAEGLDVAGLSQVAAERFIVARRARVARLFRSRRALEPLVDYLRELGVELRHRALASSLLAGDGRHKIDYRAL